MSAGPLRRLLGGLGLAALAPVAWRLADGSLDPMDAAVRAVITLLVVVVVGRLLSAWVHAVATTYDQAVVVRDDEPGPANA